MEILLPAPFLINGCDLTDRSAGNVSKLERGQTRMPEQRKHDLAELSGILASPHPYLILDGMYQDALPVGSE